MTLSQRATGRGLFVGFSRADIGRMTRAYIFDVLWYPRHDDGSPDFADELDSPLDAMRATAIRHGIPYARATKFAQALLRSRR